MSKYITKLERTIVFILFSISGIIILSFFLIDSLGGAKKKETQNKLNQIKWMPKESDVIMRNLVFHPSSPKDPHDTLRAIKDFYVNRIEWSYIDNPEYIDKIRSSGCVIGGSVSAQTYKTYNGKPYDFPPLNIKNAAGEIIIASWKKKWRPTLWGCMNNPQLRSGYFEYIKRCLSSGIKYFHRDEPMGNFHATRWKGCFCKYCMEAFEHYVDNGMPYEDKVFIKKLLLRYPDLKIYFSKNYKNKNNSTYKNAYRIFKEFQLKSTVDFHKDIREMCDNYAKTKIGFSCNLGPKRYREISEIELLFDWWYVELKYEDTTPDYIYDLVKRARYYGKKQLFTMPKSAYIEDTDELIRLTRLTIATAYANGTQCLVPWDIYMSNKTPRYFGKPYDFNDLFAFVRRNAKLLDGFKEHGIVYKKLAKESSKAMFVINNKNVFAVERKNPDVKDIISVIHLVDWSKNPTQFSLKFNESYYKDNSKFNIEVISSVKGKTEICAKVLKVNNGVIHVPELDPWGILVIRNLK